MKRNYGIDLLRCVSMFMVVVLHTLGDGGILKTAVLGTANYNAVWFLETACYCAVNCYALISGYVGVRSKFKYSNIILLWLQVLFYTLIIAVTVYFTVPDAIGVTELAKSIFPFTNRTYWYFTAYSAAFFLFPVLNGGINTLSEKQARYTVFAIVAVFSAVNIILELNLLDTAPTKDLFNQNNGYSVIWLILLYIIGGCIGKYNLLKNIPSYALVITYVLCVLLSWGTKLMVERIGLLVSSMIFIDYISLTVLFCGISLVELFSRFRFSERSAKIVSFLAPTAFGIYLYHENPIFRDNFIKGRFAVLNELNTAVLVVWVLVLAILIFAVGVFIERIRIWLFKILKIKELVCKIDR